MRTPRQPLTDPEQAEIDAVAQSIFETAIIGQAPLDFETCENLADYRIMLDEIKKLEAMMRNSESRVMIDFWGKGM